MNVFWLAWWSKLKVFFSTFCNFRFWIIKSQTNFADSTTIVRLQMICVWNCTVWKTYRLQFSICFNLSQIKIKQFLFFLTGAFHCIELMTFLWLLFFAGSLSVQFLLQITFFTFFFDFFSHNVQFLGTSVDTKSFSFFGEQIQQNYLQTKYYLTIYKALSESRKNGSNFF